MSKKTEMTPEQMLAYMTEAVEEVERLRRIRDRDIAFLEEVWSAIVRWNKVIKRGKGRACDTHFILSIVHAYEDRQNGKR